MERKPLTMDDIEVGMYVEEPTFYGRVLYKMSNGIILLSYFYEEEDYDVIPYSEDNFYMLKPFDDTNENPLDGSLLYVDDDMWKIMRIGQKETEQTECQNETEQ